MRTDVEYKTYHTMGDLNDDSKSGIWPAYCGDKVMSDRQFHKLNSQRTIPDAYIGYHTEVVKQKILEHEAIFKSQLYELHRLYRVQRDLMDELKMIELEKKSMAVETSLSSCSASQKQGAQRHHTSSAFCFTGSGSAKDLQSALNLLTSKYAQNGVVSQCNAERTEDCEVEILDCIPSNSGRKFNLELRADQYIDVKEPTYHSKFLGRTIEINSGGDGVTLCKDQNWWGNLNKKIQLQKTYSSSPNVYGCDSNIQSNHLFSSKSLVHAFPREFIQASQPGQADSSSACRNVVEWSHMVGSARSEGQTMTYSQNLLSENINLYNKCQGMSFLQLNRLKAECCKEGSGSVPKHSDSGMDFFKRLSNPHQLDKSFSTSNGPWERSGNCMTQKSATVVTHPCFNSTVTLPQSFQTSSKSINQNGFYKEPYLGGSGPAQYPTSGCDYFNRSNGSFVASGLRNGLGNSGENSMKGIDLNVVIIGNSHNSVDRKEQGFVYDLQWLKPTSEVSITMQTDMSGSRAPTLGASLSGESHLSNGADSSCRSSVFKEEETDKVCRIRGFDMNLSCESEEKDTETVTAGGRNLIDLNLCLTEEEEDADLTRSAPGCHQLNTTIRGFDSEAPSEVLEQDDIYRTKHLRPGSGSCSDDDLVNTAAEALVEISCFRKLTLTRSPVTNPLETTQNTLNWFVDKIIPLIPDDPGQLLCNKAGDDTEEADSVDYFEYMTLQLPETKEYDYHKPLKSEEPTGEGLLTTRTRKGQARRGRPRRDFQRDTLPGLTSLSRHEVTEDLQTFGGLMRATGHSWSSGGRPRRGRPRLTPVQPAPSPQLYRKTTNTTNTELINIEGRQSLSGWGERTRRPRRQRCHPYR